MYNLPLEVRLAGLFVIGLLLGGQLNRGIYRLAWNPRSIGPWSRPADGASPRRWWDRVPVWGWVGLSRESSLHGRGYWIRPLLIEVGTALGLVLLYLFETERLGLYPVRGDVALPSPETLHAQFLLHAVLIGLMVVATFIDLDERMIPDSITVNGTLLALVLVSVLPQGLLPVLVLDLDREPAVHHLVWTSSAMVPGRWMDGLGGPASWPPFCNRFTGLLLGLACLWSWCLAIMHRTWTTRHGILKAWAYMAASIVRHRYWIVPAMVGAAGSVGVAIVWQWFPEQRWEALLSSLIGMVFGGGLIWAIRIVGGHALKTEAMGFGDVTLMAMIGAFLGWQPAFLIFFLAPFAALFIALLQWIFTRDRRIAFGPYLCFAALLAIVNWTYLWNEWAAPIFSVVWLVPSMLVVCVALMGLLLTVWRAIRGDYGEA